MGRKRPDLSQFTDEEILHEAAKRLRAKQTHLPNPKVLRLCPKGCGKQFGGREMRKHVPTCEGP